MLCHRMWLAHTAPATQPPPLLRNASHALHGSARHTHAHEYQPSSPSACLGAPPMTGARCGGQLPRHGLPTTRLHASCVPALCQAGPVHVQYAQCRTPTSPGQPATASTRMLGVVAGPPCAQMQAHLRPGGGAARPGTYIHQHYWRMYPCLTGAGCQLIAKLQVSGRIRKRRTGTARRARTGAHARRDYTALARCSTP